MKMEDNFIIGQIEGDLNIVTNGRQLQYFSLWQRIKMIWYMEDDLNILLN
jgi:hypothetical protein